MDAKLKRRWVKALRSGKYKQAREHLKILDKFCCIGVGYDLIKPGFEETETCKAGAALGLTTHQWSTLADMNDLQKKNFRQIADYIEANL